MLMPSKASRGHLFESGFMTNEMNGRIEALMARYVAGTLPEPARILVDTHLALKDTNRDLVQGLEAMAGDDLEKTEIAAVTKRDERLERIFVSSTPKIAPRTESTGIFPAPLKDFVGFDADQVPWRTKLPGFREFDIGEFDGCHASLFWIRPGRKIPAHDHEGMELTLVLHGAFSDVFGRYGRGEIAVADETVDHRPIAENETPCIGFAVTEGSLRLSGPVHQRLGDILGL